MFDFLKQNQRFLLNNEALPTSCRIQVWTYSSLLLPKKLDFQPTFLGFWPKFSFNRSLTKGNLQIFFTSTPSINGYGQSTEFWASESRFWASGSRFWTCGQCFFSREHQKCPWTSFFGRCSRALFLIHGHFFRKFTGKWLRSRALFWTFSRALF